MGGRSYESDFTARDLGLSCCDRHPYGFFLVCHAISGKDGGRSDACGGFGTWNLCGQGNETVSAGMCAQVFHLQFHHNRNLRGSTAFPAVWGIY